MLFMQFITLSFVVLGAAVAIGVYFFKQLATEFGLTDVPNHRSSHETITPRSGGLVFMMGWLIWMITAKLSHWIAPYVFWQVVPSVLLIAAVGLLDDRFSLPARWRFAIHSVAAALFLVQLGELSIWHFGMSHWALGGLMSTVLAMFMMLWSINLFNFMDGTDGLAGCEALSVLGIGGLFAALSGAPQIAIMAWSLTIAVTGFLWWNWPPAKIFMGDVGSTSLGFLVVALALMGQKTHDLSLIPWVILYSAFLVDATSTLIRRMLRGENWTQAHRSHAYQRLTLLGWSHAQVLGGLLFVNLALAVIALWAFFNPQFEWLALMLALALTSACYLRVNRLSAEC